MARETLYEIAFEMLQTTNVFPKDISELSYASTWEEENISLLRCVETETKKNHRLRGKSIDNLQIAYDCIASAMVVYLDGYPAVYSFKQQVKKSFLEWLSNIQELYDIGDNTASEALNTGKSERDTGVAMLKLLHDREGITYDEIKDGLGEISYRAIQKDLIKLSPSLYKGNGTPDVPFRLGGQPLIAKVEQMNPNENRAKFKRFRTLNSIHPLVLQENIVQIATLLKALSRQYFNEQEQDDVCRIIGVDIWSQMSEYAREKIINYYAFDDVVLADFIFEISNPCPDDHGIYRTEKEMLQEVELSVNQALPYLMKAPGRTGVIKLTSGKHIVAKKIDQTMLPDGTNAYCVTDESGVITTLKRFEIDDISVLR